jgi:hypothetical protein
MEPKVLHMLHKQAPIKLFLSFNFLSFFFFVVRGFELRAHTLSHSANPFFVMGFFEIGSCELFAGAGFEL